MDLEKIIRFLRWKFSKKEERLLPTIISDYSGCILCTCGCKQQHSIYMSCKTLENILRKIRKSNRKNKIVIVILSKNIKYFQRK